MISFHSPTRYLLWSAVLAATLLLAACEQSQPSASQVQAYVENYQIAHDYNVVSMNYEVEPKQRGESGSIQVSGKLELRDPLYVEDLGNKEFRKSVAKMLRRNRFSEREINHEIYDRVIRASVRVPNSENEYYTLLKEEQAPGFAINFSANLIYKKGNDGFMLDGPVRHPKLAGARIIKFANPIVDNSKLVEKAVKSVLAEQIRYREMMKGSSALLSRFWDNEFGLVIWNRKVPYLGNENLSSNEKAQLDQFSDWRGVFRVSNIKPVQYRTPHATNFFELGSYVTEGVATCLRQTGFIDELTFAKSKFDQYCELGKQYPVRVELASVLNEINEFVTSVKFEVSGVSSGELIYDSSYFQREHNELARYSDQQRVVILDQPFNINAHNRPVFSLLKPVETELGELHLKYTDASDYELARFNTVDDFGLELAAPKSADNELANTSDSEQKEVGKQSLVAVGANDDELPADVQNDEVENNNLKAAAKGEPLTQKELVKAIQIELARLNVYNAEVDGIAGEYTFWSMAYVEKQLGKGDFSKPSEEFLSVLVDTPDTAVKPPETPYKYKSIARTVAEPKKEKQTVAGKALKGTGRAIDNAASWVGGLFSNKKRKKKED